MEFIDVLENVPKDKFRATANKLLNECFILKKNKDTISDYNFILNYRDYFISLFDVLGYELVIQEDQGVIGINNPAGTGRIHLKKIEGGFFMNEQCIQVNNLTKSFSGRKVINDLSFEVNKGDKGEVFALLGHGCLVIQNTKGIEFKNSHYDF